MAVITRSQTRKQHANANSENLAPPIVPPGSPFQLKHPSQTAVNQQLRRALSRAMSQSWVSSGPVSTTQPSLKLAPKPLQAYTTPIHLIGKGIENPDLLKAPKGKKAHPRLKIPAEIKEQPEDELASDDTCMQVDDPVGSFKQRPATNAEARVASASQLSCDPEFLPAKSLLKQMVPFLGDWFDPNDLDALPDEDEEMDQNDVDEIDPNLVALLGKFFKEHPCPGEGASLEEWTSYTASF
ncbi:hypothetical protein GYMLUDRAFT_53186 [Collybiopsis luxurians FD-317 M1]|nr:hypothetical protein GYMLUDRAFT_53186 [Collybiopsis luxurians FD-317 M1]